jgi:hypothetical protein
MNGDLKRVSWVWLSALLTTTQVNNDEQYCCTADASASTIRGQSWMPFSIGYEVGLPGAPCPGSTIRGKPSIITFGSGAGMGPGPVSPPA